MSDVDKLWALAHMAACGALAWCCLCRISAMGEDTTRSIVRAAYAVLFTVAVAAGSMPIWVQGYWGRIAALTLAIGYVLVMAVNAGAWKQGPPAHARTAPGEFDDTPHHHWNAVSGGKGTP
jgi:hypothetical protein